MKNLLNVSLVIVGFSLLMACSDSDAEQLVFPISGRVIDVETDKPIAGVTITILDNGPSAITNKNGAFNFSDSNLVDIQEISISGSTELAVSIIHPDYRPKEINLPLNGQTSIKISSKDASVYSYHRPVQISDGLTTGTLEDVNLDPLFIQGMMNNLYSESYKEVHSVLVYKSGKLVLEEYYFGNNDTIQFENGIKVDNTPAPIQWSRTEKHYVASVNKALTSTVIGIALDQHNVAITDRISPYLPQYSEYFTDPNKGDLDFEDCLTMTAGFTWDEWSSNDLALLWASDEFGDFLLSRNNLGAQSEWRYNSALPNLMLKAIDEMVEGNVRDWADQNFYQKLGITDYNWQSQPDGYPEGSARMFIRPRDMLKVGITYLNGGVWNGEQVIPSSWVDACFESKVPAGDYSYYFWLRTLDGVTYLSADGDGGNYINIFPEQDMVVVFTQGLYLKWPTYFNQADDMMKNYIFPALN
ncbi:MAG: CubicO group peptidase (beta-lactamase class C family) [Cyclobacteriaceae bacterium]|jgi:CubicO group peptidase (beta-lactamase class C family)